MFSVSVLPSPGGRGGEGRVCQNCTECHGKSFWACIAFVHCLWPLNLSSVNFFQLVGGGRGVKFFPLECCGKSKNGLKNFHTTLILTRGCLNFACLYLQKYLSYLSETLVCCRTHIGLPVHLYLGSYDYIGKVTLKI